MELYLPPTNGRQQMGFTWDFKPLFFWWSYGPLLIAGRVMMNDQPKLRAPMYHYSGKSLKFNTFRIKFDPPEKKVAWNMIPKRVSTRWILSVTTKRGQNSLEQLVGLGCKAYRVPIDVASRWLKNSHRFGDVFPLQNPQGVSMGWEVAAGASSRNKIWMISMSMVLLLC